MSNFLTVEDVNSCFMNAFDCTGVYECDVSEIGITDDYTSIPYDFLEVSHTIGSNTHTFEFKIKNSAWTGGYYVLIDGEFDSGGANWGNNALTITSSSENVVLGLYLSYLQVQMYGFNLQVLPIIPLDSHPMFLDDDEIVYHFKELTSSVAPSSNYDFTSEYDSETGVYILTYNQASTPPDEVLKFYWGSENTPAFAYNVLHDKHKIKFLREYPGFSRLMDYIIPGKSDSVVHVVLDTVIPTSPSINQPKFYYDGEELDYLFDGVRLYSVDLDLSEHRTLDPVKMRVKIRETEDYLGVNEDLFFYPKDEKVTTFTELYNETRYGTPFIEVMDSMQFTNNIHITGTCIMDGGDNTLDLNNYSIILQENASLNLKNITIKNGDKAIIQGKNSKLILTDVNFENNISENVGSCIYCKVDPDNINENDDFTTILTNCNFINNNSCISHNGKLTVHGCAYLNNDLDYAHPKFPAFLYQNNGEAGIRNSIFDIDYTDDDFCSDEQSIGFAQSLIHCGETAIINNKNMVYLQEHQLPFFEAPYNNRSHLFAKYYYPKIEACAYSSPLLGFEDKCLCYSIEESNWVFKQNVQVTRADSGDENTVRRITYV